MELVDDPGGSRRMIHIKIDRGYKHAGTGISWNCAVEFYSDDLQPFLFRYI